MEAAGFNTEGFDYSDILLANSFLDIQAIVGSTALSNGCSSLMAWGEATKGTDLKGKSIITRNLDWTVSKSLINNNLILIHIPAEEDEQPWLSIGYIGHTGALSGTNQSGLSVFQHVMYDDFNNDSVANYEPIWFTVRKALEQKDYDGNGQNDVRDLKKIIRQNTNGYANGFIITAMASSKAGTDSLVAMVAELGPEVPFATFRSNQYNDKFDGQILYAANYPICRKDRQRYGNRYNAVYRTVSNGSGFDETKSWKIMTTASCLSKTNLQTMQIVPELGILKLSVWKNEKGAYHYPPKTYDLDELFAPIKE